jgi:Na+(H+)/acetate symporter ActP
VTGTGRDLGMDAGGLALAASALPPLLLLVLFWLRQLGDLWPAGLACLAFIAAFVHLIVKRAGDP